MVKATEDGSSRRCCLFLDTGELCHCTTPCVSASSSLCLQHGKSDENADKIWSQICLNARERVSEMFGSIEHRAAQRWALLLKPRQPHRRFVFTLQVWRTGLAGHWGPCCGRHSLFLWQGFEFVLWNRQNDAFWSTFWPWNRPPAPLLPAGYMLLDNFPSLPWNQHRFSSWTWLLSELSTVVVDALASEWLILEDNLEFLDEADRWDVEAWWDCSSVVYSGIFSLYFLLHLWKKY